MNLAKYATIAGNLCRSGLFLGEGMLKIASLKDQVRYQMLTGCVLKKCVLKKRLDILALLSFIPDSMLRQEPLLFFLSVSFEYLPR